MYYPNAGCAICGRPIGTDTNNILGFDLIEFPEPDFPFHRFADGFAHISCLSNWERRDEFIEKWNRALREYYVGKELRVDNKGRVTYIDARNWRIQHSPTVQRRAAEEFAQIQEQFQTRRKDLSSRIEATRQKAIRLGLATSDDVDKTLHDMSPDLFRKHFEEFRVSRAFFKTPN